MRLLFRFVLLLTSAIVLTGCQPRAVEKVPSEEPEKKEQPKLKPGEPAPF